MRKQTLLARRALVTVGAVMAMIVAEASVWKGGTDMSWNTAANWDPATVPNASGAEADLSAASGTITVSSAITVGRIVVGGSGTLTLSGAKVTFAGSDKPEVSVGAGRTFSQTTVTGGTQGLRKTGGGTYAPTLQSAGNSFAGGLVVENGVCKPVKNGNNNHWCGAVDVRKGASFDLGADFLSSSFVLGANGGTISYGGNIDYTGRFDFSDGGRIWNTPLAFIDNAAAAVITAKGTGRAGTFEGGIGATSRYGATGTKINYRTIQVDVTEQGGEFAMTGRIVDNRLQAANYGNDIYHAETDTACNYAGQLRKVGNGDLLLFDEIISLTGPTTVDAGRLILSNSVKMSASAIRLAVGADQIVLRKGATLKLGSLSCAADGDIDLSGNDVDLGGTASDGDMVGTFSNGTIRKVGNNVQRLGVGQGQRDWDVLGGTLAFGLPSPVVRYTFDDPAALGEDSGKLGKTLAPSAPSGVAFAAEGKRGGCVSLTGAYLKADSADGLPLGNSAFTMSLWVKPLNAGGLIGWGPAASGYNGFMFGAADKLKHTFWEGASVDVITGSGTFRDGAWHHVVITYEPNSRTRHFYVDGALFHTVSNGGTRNVKDGVLTIGFAQGSGVLNGWIDEVSVFDRVLSLREIQLLEQDILSPVTAFGEGGTVRLERSATLELSRVNQNVGSIQGKGNVVLSDGAMLTVGSGDSSIGRLAGDGTLVKNGTGTLTFERAGDLGGTIDLKGGSVAMKGACVSDELKNHLVAYWDFNDRDDPGRDVSGNGMTVRSYVVSGTGNNSGETFGWRNRFETVGGAAYFDGVNNHHLVLKDAANESKLPSGNASFTTAAWFNPAAGCATDGGLIFWGNGKCVSPDASHRCNGLRLASATKMIHYFWSNDLTSSDVGDIRAGDVPDGWHHVAVTYDSVAKVRTLYFDGVVVGSDTIGTAKSVEAANFMIGCSLGHQAALQKFTGYLDDIMIFDKALSAGEIKTVSRGFSENSRSGSSVKTAAGTTLSIEAGTVALGEVQAEGAVSVAAGATLALTGHSALGQDLTCAGEIDVLEGGVFALMPGAEKEVSSLSLEEGSELAVTTHDSPSLPALEVVQAVALPKRAVVTLTVPDRTSVVRVPLIRFVGGYSGDVSGWTVAVNTPRKRFSAELAFVGDVLWVTYRAKGLMLIIK